MPADRDQPETRVAGEAEDALLRPVSRRRAAMWHAGLANVALLLVLTRNIALVPMYVSYIGPLEFSVWLASGAVLSRVGMIDFGLLGVLIQQVAAAYGARDRPRLQTLVGTGLGIVIVIAAVTTLLAASVAPFVPGLLGQQGDDASRLTRGLLIVALANGAQILAYAVGGMLRGLQRTRLPGLLRVIAEVLALALIPLLLLRGFGYHAIALSLLARALFEAVGNALAFVPVVFGELRLRPRGRLDQARALWRLSVWQFLTQLAMRFKAGLDPFLVGVLLGPAAAGAYALTIRAHEMVRLLGETLGSAVTPSLAHLVASGARERVREIVFAACKVQGVIVAVGLGGVVAFNTSFLHLWVGAEFDAGPAVTVLAGLWIASVMLGSVTYDANYAMARYPLLARVVWTEALVRLPLVALMLWLVGPWGAPAAALLTQVFLFVVPLARTLAVEMEIAPARVRSLGVDVLRLLAGPAVLSILALLLLPAAGGWGAFVAMAAGFAAAGLALIVAVDRPLVRFLLARGRGSATSRPG